MIVLKIIGILLIIIFIIIFSNIKFKVLFNNEENISYFIKISYLLGIFTYTLDSKNNLNNLKILGINIEKFKKNKTGDIKIDNKDKNLKHTKISQKEETNNQKKESFKNDKDIKHTKINQKEEINNQKKESFKNDKIDKFKFIYYKLKHIINYPFKKEIINLFLILLKRLFKAITLKQIKINIHYGLDDPFKTGNIYGIINATIPFLPKSLLNSINVVPYFEEKLFLMDLHLKFKTSLFRILLPIFLFISKKPIRKIIFRKGE